MRTSQITAVLPILALLLATTGCDSSPKPTGEKIELKLNLKKGDTRKLAYEVDMNTKVSAKGKEAQIGMQIGFGLGVEVEDVDDAGLHTMKITYDRIRFKASGGPTTIDYDSDKSSGADNPATQMFQAMVGASLTLKVTPDGKTTEVLGLDEFADKIAAKAPPGGAAQIRSQLDGMKKSFDQMMAPYPKEPVDICDTWTGEMNLASDPNLPMTVKAKYTLHDRKDGVAIIKIDGQMSSTAGISGTMTGTMEVEEETGWTKGGTLTMKMSGKVQDSSMEMDGKITFGNK